MQSPGIRSCFRHAADEAGDAEFYPQRAWQGALRGPEATGGAEAPPRSSTGGSRVGDAGWNGLRSPGTALRAGGSAHPVEAPRTRRLT